jgi:hypothetical protein
MPSSRPDSIPAVISLVWQISPASILDVGVGFGKWGGLFREYTDIILSERDTDRYDKPNWKVTIEGIEAFPRYLTMLHAYAYDRIHTGDVRDVLPTLGKYDLVFMGDMIEHLPKPDGMRVIKQALNQSAHYVIITTPRRETGQEALCNNQYEVHRALWHPRDFVGLGSCDIAVLPNDILLAIFRKPGQPRVFPFVPGPKAWFRRAGGKLIRWLVGDGVWSTIRGRLRRAER